jgi:hypothetical protein
MEALLFCHRQIRELGLGQIQQRDLLQQWFGKLVGMAGWVQNVAAQQERLVQSVCRLQGSVNDQLLEMVKATDAKANEAFDLAQRVAEATMEHQQSFEKVKGWPGWERIGETCNKVAMLEATLTRLAETVKALDGQTQVLTAKVANLNPISATDVQREVEKAETHFRQYVETRIRDIEQHIKVSKVSSGNQEPQVPPEVNQKLAQLEDHLGHVEKQLAKEREEFAKTLGATRLRTYEKEKTFEAQIARLESQISQGAMNSENCNPNTPQVPVRGGKGGASTLEQAQISFSQVMRPSGGSGSNPLVIPRETSCPSGQDLGGGNLGEPGTRLRPVEIENRAPLVGGEMSQREDPPGHSNEILCHNPLHASD